MPDAPSRLDRLKQHILRFAAGVRPHHVAAALAMAVIGAGVVAARGMALPAPPPIGERLQIQVVAPEEAPITPGSVMEVGDLVQGFDGVPPPPPAVERAAYAPWDEEAERPGPRPSPERHAGDAVLDAPPQSGAPSGGWRDSRAARWFGFDAPERDYRAEREARRARRDAQAEREREPREVRRYRSDGRPDDGDWRDARRREDEGPSERFD